MLRLKPHLNRLLCLPRCKCVESRGSLLPFNTFQQTFDWSPSPFSSCLPLPPSRLCARRSVHSAFDPSSCLYLGKWRHTAVEQQRQSILVYFHCSALQQLLISCFESVKFAEVHCDHFMKDPDLKRDWDASLKWMLLSLQVICRKLLYYLAGSPVIGSYTGQHLHGKDQSHLHLLSVVLKAGADVCKIYKTQSLVKPSR